MRKGRCKGRAIQASLFGVGAPEALVIGVVALLVFGPKGLAEVSCAWRRLMVYFLAVSFLLSMDDCSTVCSLCT